MKDINKKCIILALNSGSLILDINQIRSLGLPFKCLVGSYKGTLEDSFLVTYDTYEQYEKVLKLARKFSQESVLMLNEDRDATLYYLESGDLINLGPFVSVLRKIAYSMDAWTLDLKTGNYYITEGL